jgi:hypothetical protein
VEIDHTPPLTQPTIAKEEKFEFPFTNSVPIPTTGSSPNTGVYFGSISTTARPDIYTVLNMEKEQNGQKEEKKESEEKEEDEQTDEIKQEPTLSFPATSYEISTTPKTGLRKRKNVSELSPKKNAESEMTHPSTYSVTEVDTIDSWTPFELRESSSESSSNSSSDESLDGTPDQFMLKLGLMHAEQFKMMNIIRDNEAAARKRTHLWNLLFIGALMLIMYKIDRLHDYVSESVFYPS